MSEGEKKQGKPIEIFTFEQLRQHFDKPIHLAAANLGAQIEDIKASYKKYGMKRWPFTGSRIKRTRSHSSLESSNEVKSIKIKYTADALDQPVQEEDANAVIGSTSNDSSNSKRVFTSSNIDEFSQIKMKSIDSPQKRTK